MYCQETDFWEHLTYSLVVCESFNFNTHDNLMATLMSGIGLS